MSKLFATSFLRLVLLTVMVTLGTGWADDGEAYTKVLDRLTSVPHFSDRPVLFVIGFDTSKSMSVEFDRSKKLTQTLLARYSAPGDSVYIFGFADKASVLPATASPKQIPKDSPDSVIASLNEGLLGLPRSSAKGTLFGRAKLFALEKMTEFGKGHNTVVLLFSDNNSELEMGTNERQRLETLEKKAARSETVPLLSQGVSPLWLTLYSNDFPDPTPLAGPGGETGLDNPRLAWAARRVGSQVLQFIEPASPRLESFPAQITVQFLGSTEPKEATLTVDGKHSQKAVFKDGRASWTLNKLAQGNHLLFAQAVLADGKVRTAELSVAVQPPTTGTGGGQSGTGTGGASPTPTPAATASATPTPTPSATPESEEGEDKGGFPWIFLVIAGVVAGAIFMSSLKPAKVRVVGPNGEESFLLQKGKSLRLGGKPRVESDMVFQDSSLEETIASVSCTGFGKAVVKPESVKKGEVDIETDEGHTALESGEPLLTSATVTFTNDRGGKEVFTFVREEPSSKGSEDSGHFGGESDDSDDGGDWRA